METNLTLQNAAWIWPSAEFTRNQRANFFRNYSAVNMPIRKKMSY